MPTPVDRRRLAESTTRHALGCVTLAALYQDELLESPPSTNAPLAERRRYAALAAQAGAVCSACPVAAECLYRAVVEHDVAGYVAGTTEKQRREIRRRLGITVGSEDFDTLAGVTGHRQVDHDEVVRLRRAKPHESLEQLAQRLGCSLSTVKRHLRRERNSPAAAPKRNVRPSRAAALAVTAEVLNGSPTGWVAA